MALSSRRALWLIAAFVAFVVVAALFAVLNRPEPPGQMVDVEGEGSPAVILDAGAADAWLTWHQIQPELASLTRVCSYDRAGIGYSDPGPLPRSRRRAVE